MRRIILALVTTLLPVVAQAQNAPATLPYHTVYGRLGATPGDTGPGQAIPFATLNSFLAGTQSANTIFAGPTSGGAALPTFRAINASDIPSNFITDAMLAQAATNTILGNPTSGTANKQDMAMPSCSATGSVLQWTTNTGFGCVTYVATFNTRTGAVTPAAGDYTLNQIYNCTLNPQGRLTFATGTPVMTSTVSLATSHFYTPYLGQQVPIYDGTRFNCVDTGGELTQTTADTTKSPSAVVPSSCYDVFVWSDSGTIRATRGTVWTNTTTRAQALQRINGILTNGTAIGNGPGQNLGTYVGTECSNASSTFDWILGAAASGGTAASLNAWNQYNRADIATTVTDNGTSYTYANANGTIRESRGGTTMAITYVSGNTDDGAQVNITANAASPAAAGDCVMGYGLDTTTAFSSGSVGVDAPSTTVTKAYVGGAWLVAPQLGRHSLTLNETTNYASNTCTFGTVTASIGLLNTIGMRFRM